MADKELDAKQIEEKVHNLAESMERMRASQADKDDVVVDMKHAKHTRLELLAEELQPVFNDVPEGSDQFEFALTNGEVPRMWIDMTSFVRMGSDRQEYEFVKDTRLGRVILGRTKSRGEIGSQVTDYVAERILERERMIEGDWISAQASTADETLETTGDSSYSGWIVFFWFLTGLLGGAGILAMAAWNGQLESIVKWFTG